MFAFSRTGKLLAVTLFDGRVVVLDTATGRIRRTLIPTGGGFSLAFSPSGTLAIGTSLGTVEFRNPNTGNPIAPPLSVTSHTVTSITFDPSGQRFATAGSHDGSIKLWSTATLQQQGTALTTDQGTTSTAAFGPAGSRLLVVDSHGNSFGWPTSLTTWEQHACSVAASQSHPQRVGPVRHRTPLRKGLSLTRTELSYSRV